MTFAILANLNQETLWAGTQLSSQIDRKLSALSVLLSALAPEGVPDDEIEVLAITEVERKRLKTVLGWSPPAVSVRRAERWDLAWAQPTAAAVNDRRFAAAIASEAGVALPGSRTIHSIDELEQHLAANGAAASPIRRWVAKATWSAAGRDRIFGVGETLDLGDRRAASTLLARGPLQFEPWMDRIEDVAVCATVDGDGTVLADAPHRIVIGPRGRFLGIELTSPLDIAEHDQLVSMVDVAGVALAKAGFTGPFGVDAFIYRNSDGNRRLHPLCEINARHTFGHVARGLARRLGIRRLGFGTPPPGATTLIEDGRGDPTIAWVA